jgi:hypothetical protein
MNLRQLTVSSWRREAEEGKGTRRFLSTTSRAVSVAAGIDGLPICDTCRSRSSASQRQVLKLPSPHELPGKDTMPANRTLTETETRKGFGARLTAHRYQSRKSPGSSLHKGRNLWIGLDQAR